MKSATISELKKELSTRNQSELIELCLRMARYKKENKELMTYLLFEVYDEENYVKGIIEEIDHQFTAIRSNASIYFVLKGLRKISRYLTRYFRYSGKKNTELQLLLHYCGKIRAMNILGSESVVLLNFYRRQLKKIDGLIAALHEDLRIDYANERERIEF
ncbi:MAG: hypothetical protein IT223_12790 [Crocinitomicaceae bacterium]|nr:hypothetical protein [Crocinitomicaceae bacterium]